MASTCPEIIYDIMGFNRDHVVDLLTRIVNREDYQREPGTTPLFYFGISKVSEALQFQMLFKLT